MTIVRPRHPLEGLALEVVGRRRLQGEPFLILILPDGSHSLIPAAWTDLHTSHDSVLKTIGTLADLLRARLVVNALLRRLGSQEETLPAEKEEHARAAAVDETTELVRVAATSRHGLGVDNAESNEAIRDCHGSGASDSQEPQRLERTFGDQARRRRER